MTANPTQNPPLSNDFNGVGGVGHHEENGTGLVDPATRPFGLHNPRDINAPGATMQVDGTMIPAAGAASKGSGSAGEKAFVGKLEHIAGSILCSSSLKAKGIQKERYVILSNCPDPYFLTPRPGKPKL